MSSRPRPASPRARHHVRLIGQPDARRGARRFMESLPERLLRRLPGVDVRIVADAPPRD